MSKTLKIPCIDGGSWHAWRKAGLDVRADKLVSVKVCTWCDKEACSAYKR